MALFRKKQCADPEAEKLKSFLDMIAPSLVKFEFDRYFAATASGASGHCGNIRPPRTIKPSCGIWVRCTA